MATLLLSGAALSSVTVMLGVSRPETVLATSFGVVDVVEVAGYALFVALAGLLLLRRPRHPIGWLCAFLGLSFLVEDAAGQYSLAARSSEALPGQTLAGWVAAWMFAPALTAFVEILLLFPSGRPRSRRGAWLVRGVAVLGLGLTLGWAVASWPLRGDPQGPITLPPRGWPTVLPLLASALVLCLVVAAGSLVVRYRRAEAVERLQLNWLAVAAFGLGAAAVVGLVAQLAAGRSPLTVELVGTISIAAVPVAITLAVLRYRLYEIDRILSRTVSYTLLTGLLAGVYSVGVLLVSTVSATLSLDSDVAVAASTLAVAGVFGPLRHRVQRGVDRRFNRAAYDAARTAEQFRVRLRSLVDVDELAAGLVTAVERTVEPDRVSLWLRPRDRPRSAPFRPEGGSRP